MVRLFISRARRIPTRVKRRVMAPHQEVDILVVSTHQKLGGAARAAYRTFSGIRNHYPSARYLSLTRADSDPSLIGLLDKSLRGAVAQRFAALDRIPLRAYPERQPVAFSPSFVSNPLRTPLSRFRPKLVNLHWIAQGLMRIEELGQLRCPIVWTLHDIWPFSGGCHHAGDCEGFKNMCGRCPYLGRQKENDLSQALMRRKTATYRQLNLTVVTPSRWLAGIAKESSLFANRRIEIIPNGLDTQIFKPIDRAAARQYLNLEPGRPTLLFGTQWLDDPFKGGDLLIQALHLLKGRFTLLVFGHGLLPLQNTSDLSIRHLGNLTDETALALIYSAADVFVHPSRKDNLPNTVAEALACGTPCVAFATQGLHDMINHRVNGWLARPFDPADLAEGISWLAHHPNPEILRQAARKKALTEYCISQTAAQYAALFAELIG
jgi:glycosyltransferase involved in cell wall biosynthesis